MDAAPTRRSFTCLALSLLFLGFATTQVDPMARARDPVAAMPVTGVMSWAARPWCGGTATPACSLTSLSRSTRNPAAPDALPEPLVAPVRSRDGARSPLLHIQLQLQRSLFTRGGRLDPVDMMVDATAASRPTERTEKVPAWATKLRAERMKNEKGSS